MAPLNKPKKLKKYICQYYGWISGYDDWDCDDFIIMAYDKVEATAKMKTAMTNRLTKGKSSLMLLSTYIKKMMHLSDNGKPISVNHLNKTPKELEQIIKESQSLIGEIKSLNK